ncbi:MAG TPA: hypothetical protein VER36_04010 [Flavisolibacter sp.]|nr:hypothetical protein [Flavisolibacter sp.]
MEGMTMTLQGFLELPQDQQARLLYEQGVYIGKRKLCNTSIVLYQLEGFYAEVYYHKYRCLIECISCFAGTARLDPYLAQIDVEHLV